MKKDDVAKSFNDAYLDRVLSKGYRDQVENLTQVQELILKKEETLPPEQPFSVYGRQNGKNVDWKRWKHKD